MSRQVNQLLGVSLVPDTRITKRRLGVKPGLPLAEHTSQRVQLPPGTQPSPIAALQTRWDDPSLAIAPERERKAKV